MSEKQVVAFATVQTKGSKKTGQEKEPIHYIRLNDQEFTQLFEQITGREIDVKYVESENDSGRELFQVFVKGTTEQISKPLDTLKIGIFASAAYAIKHLKESEKKTAAQK